MAAWWEDSKADAPMRGVWTGTALSILIWAAIIAVIYFGLHV